MSKLLVATSIGMFALGMFANQAMTAVRGHFAVDSFDARFNEVYFVKVTPASAAQTLLTDSAQ